MNARDITRRISRQFAAPRRAAARAYTMPGWLDGDQRAMPPILATVVVVAATALLMAGLFGKL